MSLSSTSEKLANSPLSFHSRLSIHQRLSVDERFRQEAGVQVYRGTKLLLKGALEAGVSLLTGYPGSPVADFFDVPKSRRVLLEELGIVFQMANNEALAAACIHGSQVGDLKAFRDGFGRRDRGGD